jgi:hypothetical protein
MKSIEISTERSLKELKVIVDKTIESTIECGMALKEIRDRKLFLEECGSFQEFCETNWKVTRQRAYQLINCAEVVADLPPEVSTMVDSERTVRELKKVPAEDRPAVLERASASGKVTGESVKTAAKEFKESQPSQPPPVYDRTGFQIPQPSPAMTSWLRIDDIQRMLTALTNIKSMIGRAQENKDCMFAEVNYSAAISDLSSSYQLLKVALPYAVCPTCQGRVLSPCSTCNDRGVVSEFYWKHKVSAEAKNIRERAVELMIKKGGGAK